MWRVLVDQVAVYVVFNNEARRVEPMTWSAQRQPREQPVSYLPVVKYLATEHMSSYSENVDVPFAAQVVVPDYLTVHVVDFETGMMRFDPLLDLGRAGDEDILPFVSACKSRTRAGKHT